MSFYFHGETVSAEGKDEVRGFSLNTNDNFRDGEDEYFDYDANNNISEEYVDENGEDDKAPVMSLDYYDQVENFLSREPPRIGDSASGKDDKSKKKKKKKEGVADSEYLVQDFTQVPTLPPVNISRRQAQPINEAKPTRKKSSDGNSKKHKFIDSQLLKEAFAYTDGLLRNSVLEEAVEYKLEANNDHDRSIRKDEGVTQKERKTHSAPAADIEDRDYLFYGAPTGKGKNAPVNVVRSLKLKKKQGGGSNGGRPVHADNFFVK